MHQEHQEKTQSTGLEPILQHLAGESTAMNNSNSSLPNETSHRSRHTPEDKFPCKVCGQLFTSPHNIPQHHRAKHTDERFPCEVCAQAGNEKTFTSIGSVRRHMKTQHNIEVPTTRGKRSEKRTVGPLSKPIPATPFYGMSATAVEKASSSSKIPATAFQQIPDRETLILKSWTFGFGPNLSPLDPSKVAAAKHQLAMRQESRPDTSKTQSPVFGTSSTVIPSGNASFPKDFPIQTASQLQCVDCGMLCRNFDAWLEHIPNCHPHQPGNANTASGSLQCAQTNNNLPDFPLADPPYSGVMLSSDPSVLSAQRRLSTMQQPQSDERPSLPYPPGRSEVITFPDQSVPQSSEPLAAENEDVARDADLDENWHEQAIVDLDAYDWEVLPDAE